MSILGLIPARGGSKRVHGKNIRSLGGRPLIAWTIEAAQRSSCIDRIVVSTDDKAIAEVALSMGADVPFLRPSHLAQDRTPGIDSVMHSLDVLPQFDEVLLLQPTSPLRTTEDIEGIVSLKRRLSAPAAVSVTRVNDHPANMYVTGLGGALVPLVPEWAELPNSQQFPDVWFLNGALFIADTSWLRETGTFVNTETVAYEMPSSRSVDIDTESDWARVEYELSRSERV